MKLMNSLLVMVLILVLSVAAFGQDQKSPATDRSLEIVKTKGVVVVGINDSFPPMTFRDDSKKEIMGLDVDLARKAMERLGLKAEFKSITWDKAIPRLNTGDVDIVWSALSILPERENQMLFSQPYLESRQVIVVKNGSSIARKSDLKEKRIGFQRGASSEKWISSDPVIINSLKEMAAYRTNPLALKDLESGLVDAVVTDEVFARYTLTKRPGVFSVLADDFGKESYGVGFRKNDAALRDAVDKVLDSMKKDGTVDQASRTWLGATIPIK